MSGEFKKYRPIDWRTFAQRALVALITAAALSGVTTFASWIAAAILWQGNLTMLGFVLALLTVALGAVAMAVSYWRFEILEDGDLR